MTEKETSVNQSQKETKIIDKTKTSTRDDGYGTQSSSTVEAAKTVSPSKKD